MFDLSCQDQEQLQRAFVEGQYRRRQGWQSEPISYVGRLMQHYTLNRQESFYQLVAQWYQAGYDGRALVPAQFC